MTLAQFHRQVYGETLVVLREEFPNEKEDLTRALAEKIAFRVAQAPEVREMFSQLI